MSAYSFRAGRNSRTKLSELLWLRRQPRCVLCGQLRFLSLEQPRVTQSDLSFEGFPAEYQPCIFSRFEIHAAPISRA